jgi:protocatechuate 3,4-dioxygenase beta subunit
LRELIRELGVTDSEWRKVLAFLGNVVAADELVLLSDVLGLSVLVDDITHGQSAGTASNIEGPYYRAGAPLVRSPAVICRPDEPGEPLTVSGVVRGSRGEPIPHAVVDVWQAAADGRYEHQDETQPKWNLRRRIEVDEQGRYEFRTVLPAPYEIPKDGPVGALLRAVERSAFRPGHIHYRVTAEGYEPVTTMVFIAGDRWLDSDAVWAVKEDLVVNVEDTPGGERRMSFDITLAPASVESEAPAAVGGR